MRRIFSPTKGALYHIYNRGALKQELFKSKFDYQRFLFLLFSANSLEEIRIRPNTDNSIFKKSRSQQLVLIRGFCIMPNHFHIVLQEHETGGISKFMQKLQMSYAKFFSKKYETSGVVFQGPYKLKVIDSEEYINYLFSYIHMNPLEIIASKNKTLVTFNDLYKYPYSSLQEYCGTLRESSPILCKDNEVWNFTLDLIKEEFESYLKSFISQAKNMSTPGVDMFNR